MTNTNVLVLPDLNWDLNYIYAHTSHFPQFIYSINSFIGLLKCILCLEMKTATTTLSAQICTSIIEHAPLGLLCSASAQVIYSQGQSGFSTCIRSLHFVKLCTKQDTRIVSALQIMNGEGRSHQRHTMNHWNDQTWIISLTVMLHSRTISRRFFFSKHIFV